MLKRMICALTAVLFLLTLLPGTAGAVGYGGTQTGVYAAARQPSAWELNALERKVALANAEIAFLVFIAKLTPQNDVALLLWRERAIVSRIMAEAERIGATVVCTYTEHIIDGQRVLIDPMKVIRIY